MFRIRHLAAALVLTGVATPVSAQSTEAPKPAAAPAPAGHAGTWRGTLDTPQGSQSMTCAIRKDGDTWSGTISGMQGDVALAGIKVVGDTLSASAPVSTPNGTLTVWYWFVVKGNQMNVDAEVSVNGQSFPFSFIMSRVSDK